MMTGRPVYVYSPEAAALCDRVLTVHPRRSAIGHALVQAYGLTDLMTVVEPPPAADYDLTAFHSPAFVDALRKVDAGGDDDDGTAAANAEMGLDDECPPVKGCWEYVRLVAGGTLRAADLLADGTCRVALHWDGGRHHAFSAEARGFCYANDVVLGTMRLLETFARVLVVDIDAHHGDGTEGAFYDTDRVLTVSAHLHGPGLYPGTGAIDSCGESEGRYHTLNLPLHEGVDNEQYLSLLLPVLQRAGERFTPQAMVLVCGADSLAGDRLGGMNLSLRSYLEVARLLRSWALPLLVVGGGGYCVPNAARCWAAVTALFCPDPAAAAAASQLRTPLSGDSPPSEPPSKRRCITPPVAPIALCPEVAVADAALGIFHDESQSHAGAAAGAPHCHWNGVELELSPDVPHHPHLAAYAPDFRLEVPVARALRNHNSAEYIQTLRETALRLLDHVSPLPGAATPESQTPSPSTEALPGQ
jgi:histone deacetylase 8